MIAVARKALSCAGAALLPATALAQGPAAPGAGLLQGVLGFAFVLLTVLGAAWLLRRASRTPGSSSAGLRVVAAVGVGARERVVVVEVGGAWLVLGVAPGRVNALHAMPAQAAPVSAPATDNGSFAAWLKQFMERGRAS
jgi:flagellar protein FliO/FliZ